MIWRSFHEFFSKWNYFKNFMERAFTFWLIWGWYRIYHASRARGFTWHQRFSEFPCCYYVTTDMLIVLYDMLLYCVIWLIINLLQFFSINKREISPDIAIFGFFVILAMMGCVFQLYMASSDNKLKKMKEKDSSCKDKKCNCNDKVSEFENMSNSITLSFF